MKNLDTKLQQEIENFDYASLFNTTPQEEKELELEVIALEQERYERIVSKYSMDVKDHTTLKCCKRCQGKGEIKSYKHVANGVCFDCGGYGKK